MEEKDKKVILSVIVPAYNVDKYIEKTLESLINQTLKSIEIIVINDGSTDNTKELIEKMRLKDNRIKIINIKNQGVSAARNIGLKEAKGEYLTYLDGDDWIEKEAYEEMYKKAKEEDLDIVISDYLIDFNNGKTVYTPDLLNINNILSNEEYLNYFFSLRATPAIWNKIFKKEVYFNNNIYFVEGLFLGEDVLIIAQLGMAAKKIGKLNKAYTHYIQNPKSLMNNKMSLRYNDLINALNILRKYFKDKQNGKWDKKINKYEVAVLSSFLSKEPYFNKKEYIENFNIIFNFFCKDDILENLDLVSKKMKIYLIFHNKFKSKILMRGFIKLSYLKQKYLLNYFNK